MGRVREEKRRREEQEERRAEKRKGQRKEDAGSRKGRLVAKHCAFPLAPQDQKVGLLKRPVQSLRDEKLHAAVALRCHKHICK